MRTMGVRMLSKKASGSWCSTRMRRLTGWIKRVASVSVHARYAVHRRESLRNAAATPRLAHLCAGVRETCARARNNRLHDAACCEEWNLHGVQMLCPEDLAAGGAEVVKDFTFSRYDRPSQPKKW